MLQRNAAAQGLRRADLDGSVARLLKPELQAEEPRATEIKNWIFGVA